MFDFVKLKVCYGCVFSQYDKFIGSVEFCWRIQTVNHDYRDIIQTHGWRM